MKVNKSELKKHIAKLKAEIAREQLKKDIALMKKIREENEQRERATLISIIKMLFIVFVIIVAIVAISFCTVIIFTKPYQQQEDKTNVIETQQAVVPKPIIIPNNEDKVIIGEEPIIVEEQVIEDECFNFNSTIIDDWTLKEEYQEMIYNALEKYDNPVPFEWLLTVAYMEKSYNNPNALNVNSNGTADYGIMQVNSINKDIVKTVTKVDDIEVLYKPWANIRCATYYTKRLMNHYDIDNAYEFFICYNGGYGSLKKVRRGEYCKAQDYADKAVEILQLVMS